MFLHSVNILAVNIPLTFFLFLEKTFNNVKLGYT